MADPITLLLMENPPKELLALAKELVALDPLINLVVEDPTFMLFVEDSEKELLREMSLLNPQLFEYLYMDYILNRTRI